MAGISIETRRERAMRDIETGLKILTVGLRRLAHDVTTLSSVSLNLLPIPLTCMWSAPASRQILCHAV